MIDSNEHNFLLINSINPDFVLEHKYNIPFNEEIQFNLAQDSEASKVPIYGWISLSALSLLLIVIGSILIYLCGRAFMGYPASEAVLSMVISVCGIGLLGVTVTFIGIFFVILLIASFLYPNNVKARYKALTTKGSIAHGVITNHESFNSQFDVMVYSFTHGSSRTIYGRYYIESQRARELDIMINTPVLILYYDAKLHLLL